MTYKVTYFDKDTTKFSHELCQIPDEVAHGRPAFGSLRKPRPYVVGSVYPLPGTELGFGLVSEGDSDSFTLEQFGCRILGRTSPRTPHYLDPLFLEGFPVVPVEVYLVSEGSVWLAAEPFLKLGYMDRKVGSLVVRFPAVMADVREAIHDADTYLGSKLDSGLCFTTHYRPEMGLMYADYAVLTSTALLSRGDVDSAFSRSLGSTKTFGTLISVVFRLRVMRSFSDFESP